LSRVGKATSTLETLRARKKAPQEAAFAMDGRIRVLAGAGIALLALMFAVHQTQIEGAKPLLRLFAAAMAVLLAGLAWYFLRRGLRRGPAVRLTKQGVGWALGFRGWLEYRWDQIEAFRYYEPTGLAMLIKRRGTRWVAILPKEPPSRADLSWDQRFEIWLNTFHNRPGLCLHERVVRAPILDVLQAFKDYAPKALDDYDWMNR